MQPELKTILETNASINGSLDAISLIPASTVKPQKVQWAWAGRIPSGSITVLAGDPGQGKTTVATDLAAQWSRGTAEGDLKGVPAEVVIVSAEDSPAHTLVPRLIGANADLARISFVEVRRDGLAGGLSLPGDLAELADKLSLFSARVVLIDPLVACLPGEINSWRDQDVRRALAPLADMADKLNLAVVAVVHLNKAQSLEALARVSGSIGIVAAARSVLLVAPDNDAVSVRLLGHLKCNVGPLAETLRFNLEQRTVEADGETIITSGIVWSGAAPGMAAADLLIKPEPVSTSERTEAMEWLRATLASGPVASEAILKDGEKHGFKRMTLHRAKEALGVKANKIGFDGKWSWTLPEDPNVPYIVEE